MRQFTRKIDGFFTANLDYCKGCGICAKECKPVCDHNGGGRTMSTKKGIEVSIAIADAAKLARVEVIAAYPITPQTHIVEHLSEIVANGELDAAYINVESEHSAMSACCGSSATGARTFTSTSAQGMELMHEILFIASGMRLPIVMACRQPGTFFASFHLG